MPEEIFDVVNDRDEVTGNFLVKQSGLIYHAYIWTPGRKHPRDLGVIAGEDFSPQKARILLMLMLLTTSNIGEIQEAFQRY